MKKSTSILISLFTLLIGIFLTGSESFALDEPHDTTGDGTHAVACASCHFKAGQTPTWATQPLNAGDTKFNNMCLLKCHNSGVLNGKFATPLTHSYVTTSNQYGTWVVECRTCHNPHDQKQNKLYSTSGYLLTGTISDLTTTILTDSGLSLTPHDPALVGALLVPYTGYSVVAYRITDNTETSIMVVPNASSNLTKDTQIGYPYGIKYGKMVRELITNNGYAAAGAKNISKSVKFFNNGTTDGFFADGTGASGGNGICEVCHTKTQNPTTHATRYRNTGSSETPVHNPNIACTNCHLHSTGFRKPAGAACDSCHGNPPVQTGLGGPYGLANTDGGTGATSPGAHQRHSISLGYVCEKCHYNGMPATAQPGYSIQIGFSGLTSTVGTYDARTTITPSFSYQATNGATITNGNTMGCSNIYCHSDGAGTFTTAKWDVPASGACGSCHGVTNTKVPGSAAHARHVGTSAGANYKYACSKCHSTIASVTADSTSIPTVLSDSQHVNKIKNVAWDSYNPSGVLYNEIDKNCSNLYCHSNGTSSTTSTPNQTANWGATFTNCTGCHKGSNASSDPMVSGSHGKHVGTGVMDCTKCHNQTASSNTIISDYTKHVNKLVDIKFDAVSNPSGSATYKSSVTPTSKTPGSAFGSCGNLYCHSSVQSSTGGTTASYVTATWGNNGSVNCGTCHIDMTNVAAPGTHPKHVVSSSILCSNCHSGYTSTTVNTATHVNNVINVTFSGSGAGSYYSGGTSSGNHAAGGGYGNCTTTYCHSSGQSLTSGTVSLASFTTATWGGSVACGGCHAASKASVSAANSGNHGKHLITAGVSGCDACHTGSDANGTSYVSALHVNGLIDVTTALSYTGSGAPGNGYATCTNASCHDAGTGVPATTPIWGATAAACTACHTLQPATGNHLKHVNSTLYTKATCGSCHSGYVQGSTASGKHLNANVDVYKTTFGDLGYPQTVVKHNDATYQSCGTAYCHSSGQSLTSGTVATPAFMSATWNNTVTCGGCHAASKASVSAANSGGHGKHINAAGVSGCDACHASVDANGTVYDSTLHVNGVIDVTTALTYTGSGTPGNGYATCTNASCHDSGTGVPAASPMWGATASACTACHTLQPATASHLKHLSTTLYTKAICGDCHSGYVQGSTASARHLNANVDVYKTTFGDLGYPQTVAKHSNAVYQTCSTTYCHSSGQSLTSGAVSAPVYTTVTWNTAVACGQCHVASKASVSAANSGSHGKHLITAGVTGCDACHTSANAAGTVYDSTLHANGQIDVTTALSYTGSGAPGNGYATCTNASCHDAGTGVPAATPMWGATAAACTSCHALKPATASHLKHLNTTTYTKAVCGDCHSGYVQGSTASGKHLNANVDVYKTTFGDLGYPQTVTKHSNAVYQTCSTTYCHSSGQSLTSGTVSLASFTTVTWGASVACGQCHVASKTSVSNANSGGHAKHLNAVGVSGCDACHTSADANGTAYDSTLHVNNQIDVTTALSYTGSGAAGNGYATCTNASCHDAGLGVPVASPMWGATAAACSGCHTTQPATGSHLKHLNTTQYTKAVCGDCHSGYVQGTTATVKHVNANVDVYKTTVGDLGYPQTVAKHNNTVYQACSTSYCHSSGQSLTSGVVSVPVYTTVTWNTAVACGQCHVASKASVSTANSGNHAKHVNAAGVSGCDSCHTSVDANGTTYNSTLHVNGQIDVAVALSYSGGGAPGNGYGTCSTSVCHGAGAPTWGDLSHTTDATCVKCHGIISTTTNSYNADTRRASPGYIVTSPAGTGFNTAGTYGSLSGVVSVSTDTRVGAHYGHITAVGGYGTQIACSVCHQNVVSAGTTSHMDGSTTFLWSGLSNTGSLSPSYNSGTATCSTTYCHGNWMPLVNRGTGTAPKWNDAAYINNFASNLLDCAKCHNSPPAYKQDGVTAHSAVTLAAGACNSCHGHTGSGATHIDGNLNVTGGGSCNGCHDYDTTGGGTTWGKTGYGAPLTETSVAWGAHAKHIEYLKTRNTTTLDAAANSFGGTQFNAVCGVCHTQTAGTGHQPDGGNATRTIDFNGSTLHSFASAGTPTFNTGTRSCSNLDCHFKGTPQW